MKNPAFISMTISLFLLNWVSKGSNDGTGSIGSPSKVKIYSVTAYRNRFRYILNDRPYFWQES